MRSHIVVLALLVAFSLGREPFRLAATMDIENPPPADAEPSSPDIEDPPPADAEPSSPDIENPPPADAEPSDPEVEDD